MLLRATALLKARGHQFQTVLMGAGPELPALHALADELQLGSTVMFAGSTSSVEVARRLREAAVFVLPCQPDPVWMDGIPVALMEAMAIGTPVVTTATSGIPELVNHGENGFFVEPNDIAGLAACIEQVWSLMPEARSALVGQARATIGAYYKVGTVADELVRAATHTAARPVGAYTPVSIQ
jgi:glycosyltransferase involved in cell wall biosynthesis